jgi:phosphohistidine phosphatase
MIIYFLRHASAGKKAVSPKKDERRPLDQEGILQARYIGSLLASLDVQVEHILSSPLKRSLQTATLVANELAHEAAIRIEDALRPESNYTKFKEMLSRYRKYDAVMVVGHNPTESEFLSKVVSSASGTAHIELKKGSVAKVDLNGRNGVLEWLITPKIARTVQTILKPSSRPNTSRK